MRQTILIPGAFAVVMLAWGYMQFQKGVLTPAERYRPYERLHMQPTDQPDQRERAPRRPGVERIPQSDPNASIPESLLLELEHIEKKEEA